MSTAPTQMAPPTNSPTDILVVRLDDVFCPCCQGDLGSATARLPHVVGMHADLEHRVAHVTVHAGITDADRLRSCSHCRSLPTRRSGRSSWVAATAGAVRSELDLACVQHAGRAVGVERLPHRRLAVDPIRSQVSLSAHDLPSFLRKTLSRRADSNCRAAVYKCAELHSRSSDHVLSCSISCPRVATGCRSCPVSVVKGVVRN